MAARAAAQADRLHRKSEGMHKKAEHLPQRINSTKPQPDNEVRKISNPNTRRSANP